MTNQDKIDKTIPLINAVMKNYELAADVADFEGYETNYQQDKILVGLLMDELLYE